MQIMEHLRALVFECLKRPRGPHEAPLQVNDLFREVAELAKQQGLKHGNADAWKANYDRADLLADLRLPISDLVWDLIIEGVLRPGTSGNTDQGYPLIHLTAYGQQVVKHANSPHDPDGYIKALTDKRKDIDPIILRYITESAQALRRNLFLSSTMMLGTACEQAFLLLSEAFADSLSPAKRTQYENDLKQTRGIKQHHAEFMNWYARLAPTQKAAKVNSDTLSQLETALDFMFGYFRKTRNDVGHPSGVSFTRDEVEAHLVLFRSYVTWLYELMDWIKANKPLLP